MAKRVGLKMLRSKYDLKQSEIAARLGVTTSNYCRIEQGKRNGTLEFWQAVQREFNLKGDEIWNLQNFREL